MQKVQVSLRHALLSPFFGGVLLLALLGDSCSAGNGGTNSPFGLARATPTSTSTPSIVSRSSASVPGLQSILIRADPGAVDPASHTSERTITCPPGYLLAGGGFIGFGENSTLYFNAPSTTTSWAVHVINLPTPISSLAKVQAVCLQGTGLQSQLVKSTNFSVKAGKYESMDVTCPPGYIVTSGGIDADVTDRHTFMSSMPVGLNSWRGQVYNNDIYRDSNGTLQHGPDGLAQVVAVCLQGTGIQELKVTARMDDADSESSSFKDITCPSGYLLTGGGISTTAGTKFSFKASAPISTNMWSNYVVNHADSSLSASVIAMCLSRV